MANELIVRAYAKGVDQTPRKLGEVVSLVRGRSVADALVILEHTPRRAAKVVSKAIKSAQHNALNNDGIDDKTLRIDTITVTAGPRLKRYRAGAMGRAKPYQKKSSHVMVVVGGEKKIKAAPAKPAAKTDKKETK